MHRVGNSSHRSRTNSGGPARARYEKTIPTQTRRTKDACGYDRMVPPARTPGSETDSKLSVLEEVGPSLKIFLSDRDGCDDRNTRQSCKVSKFSGLDLKILKGNSPSLKRKSDLTRSGFVPPKNRSTMARNRPLGSKNRFRNSKNGSASLKNKPTPQKFVVIC